MPELPEVEAARSLLEAHVVGLCIETVHDTEQGGGPRNGTLDDKVLADAVHPGDYAAALKGKWVRASCRRGKQLWLELSESPTGPTSLCLLLHLGMTGSVVIRGIGAAHYKNFTVDCTSWPPRFTKLELTLAGHKGKSKQEAVVVAFPDPRRFGRVLLRHTSDATSCPPVSALAADPIASPPTLDDFSTKLKRLSAPVKAVLLDQSKIVCGVGNWVADECLWQAKINPSSPANSLSEPQLAALHAALLSVCTEACACNAESDRFPRTWLFHYRWANQTSGSIDSPLGKIHFETVGGRTTAFIPALQRKGLATPKPASAQKASKEAKGSKAVKAVKAAAAAIEASVTSEASAGRKAAKPRSTPKTSSAASNIADGAASGSANVENGAAAAAADAKRACIAALAAEAPVKAPRARAAPVNKSRKRSRSDAALTQPELDEGAATAAATTATAATTTATAAAAASIAAPPSKKARIAPAPRKRQLSAQDAALIASDEASLNGAPAPKRARKPSIGASMDENKSSATANGHNAATGKRKRHAQGTGQALMSQLDEDTADTSPPPTKMMRRGASQPVVAVKADSAVSATSLRRSARTPNAKRN